MTREEWLNKAIEDFGIPLFKKNGFKLPKVRVSIGLPYGRNAKKRLGEHWHPEATDDKTGSIFISPTVGEGLMVLGILMHELVHAAVGNEANHGPKFRKCALAIGLEGKMKSALPNDALNGEIKKFMKKLGEYPHSKLNLSERPTKKQSTRMVKMECRDCGFICRAAMTKIIEVGPPSCACNGEPLDVELPEDGE